MPAQWNMHCGFYLLIMASLRCEVEVSATFADNPTCLAVEIDEMHEKGLVWTLSERGPGVIRTNDAALGLA